MGKLLGEKFKKEQLAPEAAVAATKRVRKCERHLLSEVWMWRKNLCVDVIGDGEHIWYW